MSSELIERAIKIMEKLDDTSGNVSFWDIQAEASRVIDDLIAYIRELEPSPENS